jgi:hypothetical protein
MIYDLVSEKLPAMSLNTGPTHDGNGVRPRDVQQWLITAREEARKLPQEKGRGVRSGRKFSDQSVGTDARGEV